MDRPGESKSSEFFERYGRAEESNVKLHGALVLLAIVCVVLLVSLVFVSTRPKAIYYIPGAVNTGVAMADQVPKSSVESFASSWLMNWTNYAPETISSVYERSILYMAPALLAKARAQFAGEIEKVKTNRISSVYTLQDQPTIENNKNGSFNVVFNGQRGVYMGKEQMSVEKTRFELTIERVPPTTLNPYGLVVSELRKEQIE